MAVKFSSKQEKKIEKAYKKEDFEKVADYISDWINDNSLTGWSTFGHTAVDVNLYAFGPGSELFHGNQDNTAIAVKLAEILGADFPEKL